MTTLRITGGEWRGRVLRAPRAGVRPTQDRLRQSLFSSLGEFPAGARVLDLFAGTGALGFEALSRGAASACWVEADAKTFAVLQENVRQLCAGDDRPARCLRGDALSLARLLGPGAEFDLVLADPPYERAADILPALLDLLAGAGLVRLGGLLSFEAPATAHPVPHPAWSLARDRIMGNSRLLLYRREDDIQAP